MSETRKAAYFTFGRFNPPTRGHEFMFKTLRRVTHVGPPGDLFIISSANDKNPKRNPLHPEDKKTFLQKAFPDASIILHSNLITILQSFQRMGYTDIIMVVGHDRAAEFREMLSRYNGTEFEFKSVHVIDAGEGEGGIHATALRKAAVMGDKDTFFNGVPSALTTNDAEELFDLIRTRLKLPPI